MCIYHTCIGLRAHVSQGSLTQVFQQLVIGSEGASQHVSPVLIHRVKNSAESDAGWWGRCQKKPVGFPPIPSTAWWCFFPHQKRLWCFVSYRVLHVFHGVFLLFPIWSHLHWCGKANRGHPQVHTLWPRFQLSPNGGWCTLVFTPWWRTTHEYSKWVNQAWWFLWDKWGKCPLITGVITHLLSGMI